MATSGTTQPSSGGLHAQKALAALCEGFAATHCHSWMYVPVCSTNPPVCGFSLITYDEAVTELSFHPPMLTAIKLFEGRASSRAVVYGTTQTDPQLATYQVDTSRRYPVALCSRGQLSY